jgi:hypothetical protein
MSLVTAIAIIQALRYDSIVVCLLGLAGGFLTPALLGGGPSHGGSSNYFGLFAYLALLDLGLLAIAQKKDSWAVIEPLTLAATWVTYVIWSAAYYSTVQFALAFGFLTVVWLLFCGADACRIARSITSYSGLRSSFAVINSILFYCGVYLLIADRFHSPQMVTHWIAAVSISIGTVYFVSLLALLRSRAEDTSFIGRYVLTAITLLVIATALQFDGYVRVMLFAVEALMLVWCGLKWRIRTAIWSGFALCCAAVVCVLSRSDSFALSMNVLHPQLHSGTPDALRMPLLRRPAG